MHDHNHVIASRKQGRCGRKTQFVNLVVDGQVLLDIGVGSGKIGFGLVIVVVGYVVLYGVMGEECLELAVELGCQRLVVAEYQSGAAYVLYYVGYGECLARSGHAQQRLCMGSVKQPFGELLNGLRLVAGGLEW